MRLASGVAQCGTEPRLRSPGQQARFALKDLSPGRLYFALTPFGAADNISERNKTRGC